MNKATIAKANIATANKAKNVIKAKATNAKMTRPP
jgi:hypothetical protein